VGGEICQKMPDIKSFVMLKFFSLLSDIIIIDSTKSVAHNLTTGICSDGGGFFYQNFVLLQGQTPLGVK